MSDLHEYCSLRFFRKLTLDNKNLHGQYCWKILMLMPDDMDDLLAQGVTTDQIEELRLFYNTRLKERTLDTLIAAVE